jgi:hypothetical protein
VDVGAFEEAAAKASRLRDPAAYRVAADLYAGELLPADRYEAWAEDRREGLRQQYISLLLEIARLQEDDGQAIEALSKVVAEEPTHGGAHAGLMRLYARGDGAKRPWSSRGGSAGLSGGSSLGSPAPPAVACGTRSWRETIYGPAARGAWDAPPRGRAPGQPARHADQLRRPGQRAGRAATSQKVAF